MSKILEIKEKLEVYLNKVSNNNNDELDNELAINCLEELNNINVNKDILSSTKIGIILSKLTKVYNNDIIKLSNYLINKWKDILRNDLNQSKRRKLELLSSDDNKNQSNILDNINDNIIYKGKLHNDDIRDKALNYLFKAFMIGHNINVDINKVYDLIFNIEFELYNHHILNNPSQKEYNSQLKAIAFNLKDINNPLFNTKIYNGIITPLQLTTMKSIDMASDEKKLQRNSILQESIQACQSDWAVKNIFSQNKNNKGQFHCTKCKSSNTMYYQMQTRSSDEPMTTFVNCLNCQNRWKF